MTLTALYIKKNLKNLPLNELGISESNKIYINESLCPQLKFLHFIFRCALKSNYRANSTAIKRSMENFSWSQHNWQVKTFHEIVFNIIKKCVPRDPPWITKSQKSFLNKKNRLYHNYKKHGYKHEDKI